MNKTIFTIPLVALLLGGCGTNYNDVMSQWVQSQEKVAQINAERDIAVAQAKAQETLAMVNADPGGTKITDPASGFVTEVRHPNPYFYSIGGVTKTTQNSLQKPAAIPLPQRKPNLAEKALGFIGNYVSALTDPRFLLEGFGIAESNKTQRTIAEYNYRSDSDMFAAFGGVVEDGFASNTAIATQGLQSMQTTSESALGQMQILGTNYADNIADINGYWAAQARDSNKAFAENFKNDTTIIQTTEESTNSSTFTEQYPDWSTWPVVTPTP